MYSVRKSLDGEGGANVYVCGEREEKMCNFVFVVSL